MKGLVRQVVESSSSWPILDPIVNRDPLCESNVGHPQQLDKKKQQLDKNPTT